MVTQKNNGDDNEKLRQLESKLSELKFKLEESQTLLEEERDKARFYQLIADFTFGWELWFEQGGKIKYCSPSCLDLTGFTSNQVIASGNIAELLVYDPDREKFDAFLKDSIDQVLMNQSHEFRVLTRHKQLRWFSMNVRGVYNKQGRYLGVRASINDITRLKKAMGHIEELSAVKEMDDRAKMLMKLQIEDKDRELISFLLQLSKKNELITLIQNKVKRSLAKPPKNISDLLNSLLETIESTPASTLNWASVETQLEKLYPGFLARLQARHPNLSSKEKKLCAYLRLGLSSKEISGLQGISSKSVEIARVRLRKKIKLQQSTRLLNYISTI